MDDFFNDPELTKVIRGVLKSKGIAHKQDREDATQDALLALWLWSQEKKIETAEEMKAGASAITKKLASKYWRQKFVNDARIDGAAPNEESWSRPPHAAAIDALDAKRTLEEINRYIAVAKPAEKVVALLFAMSEGTTPLEHAEATGETHASVKQAAVRGRRGLRAHFVARGKADFGLLAVAVAAILLFFFSTGQRLHFEGGTLTRTSRPLPPLLAPRPDYERAPVDPTELPLDELARAEAARIKAAALLLRAERAYLDEEWGPCTRLLDAANATDPAVGDAPDLRAECNTQYNSASNSKVPFGPHRKRR